MDAQGLLLTVSLYRLPSAQHVEIHYSSVELHPACSPADVFRAAFLRVRTSDSCLLQVDVLVQKLMLLDGFVTKRCHRPQPSTLTNPEAIVYDYIEILRKGSAKHYGSQGREFVWAD